ncbi:Helicase SEN1 [Morus notabilis]|uniref:Helicase SEN1 n=1 Tax=Morus notabilis TaxID=981085 RepID=W9RFA7_9ROSA|nr:Helicase SEN1 [Morus notabilis]
MEKGEASHKKKKTAADRFTDIVFSWSLEDVFNENLFKDKVEKIPESFRSVRQYFASYVNPLLEETRAELHSSMETLYRAPFAEVISFEEAKPYGTKVYQVKVNYWRSKFNNGRGKEPYKTLPGDILVLAHCKPETVSDLQSLGKSWAFLSLIDIRGDGGTNFKVKASKEFENNVKTKSPLYVIFLVNVIPQKRIWEALHMFSNLQIITETLCNNSAVKKKCDGRCKKNNGVGDEKMVKSLSSELNESQTGAVVSCLHMMQCKKKSAVELIWGPPGTGKTKTTSTLLVTLLRRNYKILICAPTNVAITELASRVLKMVLDAQSDDLFCSLGDILLFGIKERLNIGSDMEEIYLDYRVEQLAECFGPLGWNYCFTNMINFLTYCVSEYHIILENELTEGEQGGESSIEKGSVSKSEVAKKKFKSFLEFGRARFGFNFLELKRCISNICKHTTKSYILKKKFKSMVSLMGLLDSFQSLLSQPDVVSEELEELFSHSEVVGELPHSSGEKPSFLLFQKRNECLSLLRTLRGSLAELDMSSFKSRKAIKKFCFDRASLIFCTVSCSFKLHNMEIKPTILVIDEAAQLKECESTIPLQLPGLKHAVLVGDEWQLPATVKSKVSEDAGFGRSLFERLSSQNHPRHLLSVQYRMHPSISIFPNSEFYHNQIQDSAIVKRESHGKNYLPRPMFGPYAFINIIGGREEKDDDGHSRKNMVEVAVILKILQNLYKVWRKSQHELSIGIVSPYAAQVVAVHGKLGKKYDKICGFQVKVKTVDGFQGGEEDIIIMSTVRSSGSHSLDFVSKPQRTNVALTRARHCLWILGNEKILANSQSVWAAIVLDAKKRGCFFNADHDGDLAKSITEVKKEFGQFEDMLNPDSILFKSSKWKVFFSDNFLNSFRKLTSVETKKSVINLLLRLSDGWRPRRQVIAFCESPLQINSFKVVGLSVVCTVDIVSTDSGHMQVLKIWDLLPPENIPEFVKCLTCTFEKCTEAFINLCNEKCLEGKIPKVWPTSLDIVRFKHLSMNETGSDFVGVPDGRGYTENSRVGESSLPMKFYSLSNCVVNHMLSDRDARELDLPFQVSDQEKEIILFHRSTFILGRSGTGKTTVLTMKLFHKEYLHHQTMEGLYGVKSNVFGHVNQNSVVEKNSEKTRGNVLRQLFVTSPKQCNAVKQRFSYLRSFSCSGSHSSESSLIHMDDIDAEETESKKIPDSFHGIPANHYPLIITFHQFLMMLDRTLGNSFFESFINMAELSRSQMCTSRSCVLQSFIRAKEVNFQRFCSQYWPHFDCHLTKELDPSGVFTEIISHIKGGLKSMEAIDGKLAREDYVVLSEGCASSLIGRKKRERIYDIFQIYENIKMEKGEFDLADFVNDLHRRLKRERYQGEGMNFLYVDEVQDLTMSQVALFRHVCNNVEEGFTFSGDTVETIARGIDFRIQDIRSLFDKSFVLEPKREHKERKDDGRMTNIFHLTRNFRSNAGILKLSQSIIELLYHFFPLSIDIMEPGTTTVIGETPFLLESRSNESPAFTLFGKSENTSRNVISFGAQQVILVRDESARQKIKDYVGKQALILTIMECKDLEFQVTAIVDL